MSNDGKYKYGVLRLWEVIKVDGNKLYIKGYTMANARSLAREKIAGSKNRKGRKWKRAKNIIVSVREVTSNEINSMIASSVPAHIYRKAGIMEMLRCKLITQEEADKLLKELGE